MSSRVLVFAPHADDEVLGCGATIRRAVDAGARVTVAVVTNAWEPRYPPGASELLREEAERANAVLGTDRLLFLGLPLTRINTMATCAINDAIADVVERERPGTVMVPFGGDRHEDHRETFRACMVALRPVAGREQVRRVLCYETVSGTHWTAAGVERGFEPTLFVDVSRTLDAKLRAMRCYGSQLRDPPEARSLAAIEALARWRGSVAGMLAAEAFASVWDYWREKDEDAWT